MDSFDYNVTQPDGDVVYSGEQQFQDPTSYYEADIGANVTNASGGDDLAVAYEGVFSESGEAFNGSTDATQAAVSFGPTGGTGGGGPDASRIGGLAILGVVGVLAYRRFGSGQVGRAVSNVTNRVFGR